jgi:aryl-alcohol dehydrogenase-like predicted oxidoreductase
MLGGMSVARIPFGRTGHESSRIVFGAVALSGATPVESNQVLELLLEHGVNHIDTAATYGDSEDQLRPWLAEHRDAFFLATKTGDRSRNAARDSIHRSLERMGVASVDMIQLHNLVHPGEWEEALGPGGALEAAVEARDEGLVRFVGVTGHGLTVAHQHRRALDVFPFDAVLAPCNPVALRDPVYGPDFEELARVCAERSVALQTIKAITRGPWGAAGQTAPTWYEPLTDQDEIDVAVAFVLGREHVFLNTVGDRELLPLVLDAAERFSGPPDEEALDALVHRARMTPLFVS